MIQRACQLGAMSFPQLMRELIKEATVLEEMSKTLGIKALVEEPEA